MKLRLSYRVIAPLLLFALCAVARPADRPNILVAISDDQSYPHASAYGYAAIETPAFDRVARAGLLFNNAFAPAPGCSPMRAAFLTGRNIWQIEHAGTHASSFSTKYEVYQDRLEASGYVVGYTGKGWAPGNWKVSGRSRNPAGNEFSAKKLESPQGISNNDYAANFEEFLKQRPKDQPFSFWYGATEPHRAFKKGIGREHGLDPAKVKVPEFLPDTPEIRDDILDYCFEIQWFDQHLGRMLDMLDAAGELDNTLVIVTSDNGMSFPRAKANCYEYGIHMPLAVAWPAQAAGGRKVDDLVNLIDLTATIYDVAEVAPPAATPIAGRSIRDLFSSTKQGLVDASRHAVFAGRERHSSSRFNSLGYPQRCIRTYDYLYIYNFKPERWPAGAPQEFVSGMKLRPMHGGYHDIDGCPSLTFMIDHRDDSNIGRFLNLAVDKRPAEEMFDIRSDPSCLKSLADVPAYASAKKQLHERLFSYLELTNDVRLTASDGGDIWETYPRYSALRWFPTPDWAIEHPERVPKQEWVEAQRPK